MKYLAAVVAFNYVLHTNAHYTFSKVSHNNGELSPPWYYTRNLTLGYAYREPPYGYEDNNVPYYDMYDENIRCGRGATKHGPGTKTLVVNAGDDLAFFSTQRNSKLEEEDHYIYHEGPGQAYLSKVEGDQSALEAYEGDGDWFKIGSITAKNSSRWALMNEPSMNFTIPKTTPPGNYLMRVEHVFPFSSQFNSTQFYVSCTHLEIQGPGGGSPGPMVKFPGAYDVWDSALWVPWDVGNYRNLNLTGYIGPGPPVWKG